MARTRDSWSNIPTELAGLVLERLHAHVDRVRFAAVCPHWRSAAPQVKLPPPLPLLALKDGDIFYSMPRGEPLNFVGFKGDHLDGNDGCRPGFYTACGNWLVYLRWRDLLLLDPFSGATMILPPPASFHPHHEDEGDDSRDNHDNADGVEDSEGSYDSADDGDDSEDGSVYTHDSEMEVKYSEVLKLMVCSPNLIAALLKGSENNRIAVCQPGGSKWSVARALSLWITDMAFYQGKLYVVDYHEDLLALGIIVDDKTDDPRVSRVVRVINVNQFDDDRTLKRMLYLVESRGSLLLVRRRILHKHVHDDGQIHTFAGQCEPDLSIFEADFARSQWVKVTTLDDNVALFLGTCSRAVCLTQSDSPGNRVWFLDDYKDFHLWSEYRSSLTSDTSSMANPKPFSPLPMISWKGYLGNAGAAWIFPANFWCWLDYFTVKDVKRT